MKEQTAAQHRSGLTAPLGGGALSPDRSFLPTLLAGGAAAALGLASLWVNPLLTLLCLAGGGVLVALLFRAGEPPVLLLALGYQWLQASMRVIDASVRGVPLRTLHDAPLETATALSILAVCAEAFGIALVLRGRQPVGAEGEMRRAQDVEIGHCFVGFMVFSAFNSVLVHFVPLGSGLYQPLLGVGQLKWFFFYLMTYAALVRRESRGLVAFAVLVEIVTGFFGFFSYFKDVLLVYIICYVAAKSRSRMHAVVPVAATGIVLIALSSLWMAIRHEYRNILSENTGQQVVLASVDQRYRALQDLISRVDLESLHDGFGAVVDRIAYVEMFAYVLTNVPDREPHEGGALWWAAVRHVLQPRLLFPDKPPLPSDSELTRRYAGFWVGGEELGTSVSLGFVAETYIDFGRWGMFPALVGLGFLLGGMYRFFLHGREPEVARLGCAVSVLLSARQLEMDNVKLFGSLVMTFIVAAIWLRFGIPRLGHLLLRHR